MKREQLANIIGNIEDRQIAEAFAYDPACSGRSPERKTQMKPKRIITLALAAALILALGITAYAEGWIAPIFHRMQSMIVVPSETEGMSPEFAEVMNQRVEEMQEQIAGYEEAEQYMNEVQPKPETVKLPEFDNSAVTLRERYYDGEVLFLGINLDTAEPEMLIGYEPDDELLDKIQYVAFFHDVNGDDNLDSLLSAGMTREIYDEILENRTDHGKEYDLRHQSAITLDWMMKEKLTPGKYEEAWTLLRETGHICVVESVVYIGDHIVTEDGTDLGVTGQVNMDSNDADVHSGNIFIEAKDLPESAKHLDELNIRLSLRNERIYYYMELGGPAQYYRELVGEELIPFTIENSTK